MKKGEDMVSPSLIDKTYDSQLRLTILEIAYNFNFLRTTTHHLPYKTIRSYAIVYSQRARTMYESCGRYRGEEEESLSNH